MSQAVSCRQDKCREAKQMYTKQSNPERGGLLDLSGEQVAGESVGGDGEEVGMV